MRDFRSLKVWKKSHELALKVYRATRSYPPDELSGLTSQTRRSAASIPANIAEGCGREGAREMARFLPITLGSASELEYYLLLAHDLAYLSVTAYRALAADVVEVKRMLAGLIQKLNAAC
jgi:four helix bundle protein